MWLFRLELKRILKSRRTLILLAIALLLSVAMAYLPISFEGINRPNEDGTVTELNGLAAIKYKQDLYKASAGEVTPDIAFEDADFNRVFSADGTGSLHSVLDFIVRRRQQ